MKTKYLFSAAILAGMFAACTNEDFVETSTNPVDPNDGRPTVNVKLGVDLGNNADTRLIFDRKEGYQFEVGNKIGALLMDEIPATQTLRPHSNPAEWAQLSWLEKYSLTSYIHTDYPFICTSETVNGGTVWESDAKMLEGNYFFAYPYEGYGAERQMVHSIINQKQDGGDEAAYLKSYADNQFFVGYGQIMKGNETKDALVNVNMSSVLGAVVIKLRNSATVDRTITKITLSTPSDNANGKIYSLLTIDPTKAEYKGVDENKIAASVKNYNLRELTGGNYTNKTTIFNYANYLDNAEELYDHTKYEAQDKFVRNIGENEEDNYKRIEALRRTINPVSGSDDYYAELSLTDGGKPGIVAKANEANTIEACIMINPITVKNGEDKLILTIYTTDGMVKDIDLTKEKSENNGASNTVKTDQAILNVAPNVKNSVTVTFDNNSVQAPTETAINNSDDLKQYIGWVATLGDKRLNVVELQNNAAVDAASVKLLKDNNISLYVKAVTGAKLQLPAEAGVEDALDYIIVDQACTVEVLGTANIGKNTLNRDFDAKLKDIPQDAILTDRFMNLKLEVAEGATLNVTGAQLDGNEANPIEVEVTNKGTLNVAKEGNIKLQKLTNGSATETATVNVEGKMTLAAVSTNELKGVVTVKAGGYLSGTVGGFFSNKGILHNHGAIWNIVNAASGSVKPSTVIIYKDATACNFNSNDGVIKYDELSETNTITGTIVPSALGTIQYTTVYTGSAAKSISTDEAVKYSITDLTVTEGELKSNYGQPGASASYAGAYTATTLKTLVLKGDDIKVTGYPLTMQTAGVFQVEGSVNLGASIVSATFDAKSYITGTVTVSAKVAFASVATAVANSGTTAVDHNTLTVATTPQLKNATINISAGKFLAAENVAVAANTNNAINASGMFYYKEGQTLPTTGLTVSGTQDNSTITSADGTISDK